MEIKRIGSQPSVKGPSDWFTGDVRIDQPFQGTMPRVQEGPLSPLNPAHAQHGTRIRSAKP